MVLQREIGRLLGPIWIPIVAFLVRVAFGWRFADLQTTRETYKRLRSASSSPLLICANHLTMVDSALIAVALGGPGWYIGRFASLPWNTPARESFASTWYSKALVYLMKCIPVSRGGDRREIGEVLSRISWLLSVGETALIFPEGGRSRTTRVDTAAVTYGVGRIVRAVPDCRVLCVYLRGEHQADYTTLPQRGDRFHVSLRSLEPKTTKRGLRASLDISQQILSQLEEMENEYFDDRK